MVWLREWVRKRREERSQAVTEILERAKARGYDAHDPEIHDELEAALAKAEPRIRYPARTWVWWLRWTGIAVLAYIGTAFMVFAIRHPELTDTERFLAFWDVLLYR